MFRDIPSIIHLYVMLLVVSTVSIIMIFISPGGIYFLYGLTLIPAWISNYIQYKVWDKLLIHS